MQINPGSSNDKFDGEVQRQQQKRSEIKIGGNLTIKTSRSIGSNSNVRLGDDLTIHNGAVNLNERIFH